MTLRRSLAGWTLATVAVLAVPGFACARAGDDDVETASLTLELKVKMRLLDKLGVDGLRVETSATESGRVTLSGEVKKRETRELAADVARSVEGVQRVDNRIELRSGTDDPAPVGAAVAEAEHELHDAALEARVELALAEQMGRDGLSIGTEAAGGVVTLELPASLSDPRRRQAVDIARAVEGVEKVIEIEKR